MLLNERVNIKHFYRTIEFVSKLSGVKLTHERFKLIALDHYKAESLEELKIKSFSDAYGYLLNNIEQSLTTKILRNAYYLLTDITLSDEILNKILKTFYKNYDEGAHFLAALIHFAVLENISERKIEFAFMLANLIMYKRKRNPLIPFEYVFKGYEEAIDDLDINKLMCVFASMEASYKEQKENINLSIDDILYEIAVNKHILRNKYNIDKLYLYGSFVKDKRSIHSDLDLLVIFEEHVFNFKRLKSTMEVKEFLSKKLGISVDLIDFTHAMETLDICEMENIITLI